MKLSVIVPVYNEQATIEAILSKILVSQVNKLSKEVIVIDDCSTDGTRQKLSGYKDTDMKLVLHEKNLGKGGALRTGLSHATGDIILFQDADLEYDPSDYAALVGPLVEGRADVVYGSRFVGKSLRSLGRKDHLVLPTHFVGNKVLTFLTNLLYNQKLTDMETGYNVFRSSIIKALPLRASRFDIEPEITAKLLKRRIRILEVPITYHARDFAEGKKITWKDGVKAAWSLLKYRFRD